MTETTNTNTEQTQEHAEGAQAITIQDLSLLANIVDLASKRGAFQGSELSQVGAVFDKLSAFLSFVEEQHKAHQEAEEAAAQENTDEQE